ncbi:hypothetical protein QT972_20605 [Microcoleus sp. herbarium7]|uniref:hypothetical protein n=1 Tax=Microcoleus sp. herbarium7 TaxID=3055435 RepID=UPI002FD0E537
MHRPPIDYKRGFLNLHLEKGDRLKLQKIGKKKQPKRPIEPTNIPLQEQLKWQPLQ